MRSSNNLLLLGNNGSRSEDFKNQLLISSDDESASLTKEDLEGVKNEATPKGDRENAEPLLAELEEDAGGL